MCVETMPADTAEKGKMIVVDSIAGTLAENLYSEKYFSPEDIRFLMSDAGFKITEQQMFSSEGPAVTVGYKE